MSAPREDPQGWSASQIVLSEEIHTQNRITHQCVDALWETNPPSNRDMHTLYITLLVAGRDGEDGVPGAADAFRYLLRQHVLPDSFIRNEMPGGRYSHLVPQWAQTILIEEYPQVANA